MGRRPFLACFAAIVIASLVLAPEATGCSCVMPGPPCQVAFEADAVFEGTVRSISPIPDDRPAGLPGGRRPPLGFLIQIEEVACLMPRAAGYTEPSPISSQISRATCRITDLYPASPSLRAGTSGIYRSQTDAVGRYEL